MKCTHCNKEIDNDSLYCTYCGEKIINEKNNVVINQDIKKDESINIDKNIKSENRKETIKTIITVIVLVFIIINIFNAIDTKKSSNESNIENITPEESTSNNDEIILDRMLQIHNERQKLLPKIDAAYRAFQIHLAKGYFIGTSPDRSRLINYKEEMENLCDEYIRLAYQLSDNEKIVNEAIRQKENIMSAFDNMRLY